MSSRGKKKTTMAKLNRESRLRERKQEKAARKDARRRAAINGESQPVDAEFDQDAEFAHDADPDQVEHSHDASPLPLS